MISLLNTVKLPYHINALSQRHALTALSHGSEQLHRRAALVEHERERLTSELSCLEGVLRVYPSQANFILVKFRDAARAFQALSRAHIHVRDRSNLPGCGACLRITVGTAEENKLVVQVLRESLAGLDQRSYAVNG